MDELDPKLRALLNAAQEGDDPSERDAARVRAAIALTLALPASGAGKPASGAATSILKWLGIGVVASGLIAAGVALNQQAPPVLGPAPRPPQAMSAPAAPQAPEPPSPPREGPPPEAASAAPAAPPVEVALPEPTAPQATHKQPRRAIAPRVAHEPAPTPEEPVKSLGPSELSLIRSATGALRDGKASEAMQVLGQHAQLYPEGILKQERQGLRVLALCALGNTREALLERERFLKAAPHSPLAGRVEAACTDPGAP